MNFKTIKRAEELRLNIERQDKEIIELEKVMYDAALQDGHITTMSITKPSHSVEFKNFEPGGMQTIETPFGTGYVMDTEDLRPHQWHRILERVQKPEKVKESKQDKKMFTLTNSMALEFLQIYYEKLLSERALAYKLLEECVKTLKVLD